MVVNNLKTALRQHSDDVDCLWTGSLELQSFGICRENSSRLDATEWLAIEEELDRFSAYGYGLASQRRFLHAPHSLLRGMTPAEALRQRDGGKVVLQALRCSLARLEASL
jgi:hypothetical protein